MSTGISWTEETWNPTTGCDRVSPGCDHCYAMTMAKRLKGMGSAKYQRDGDPKTSGPGFGLTVHPGALDLPLHWHKPRKVFVNSMSDLFHDAVPDGFIARVFAVMAATPQHIYQILTKRHARMRSLLNNRLWWQYEFAAACRVTDTDYASPAVWSGDTAHLPNVHLGVSVEDQKWADIRIPALIETPAAVRFLSCEPLLGEVGLDRYLWLTGPSTAGPFYDYAGRRRGGGGIGGSMITSVKARDLHWVIVGGESGPGAREMDRGWAERLVWECREADVPVFVKQLGAVLGREYDAGPHGADWDRWPEDLRIREFPAAAEVVTA